MKKVIFALIFILSIIQASPAEAYVYSDYRSDYRTVPSYNKTVQFLVARDKNRTVFYLKQNLGFSNDPIAFIIPLKGENPKVEVIVDSDPLNNLNHLHLYGS